MASEKSARLSWTGENNNLQVHFPAGYSAMMAGPAGAHGATPMEFLLAAAAGCSAMDVLTILQKKRLGITGLDLEVTGVQNDGHPHVYTSGKITFIVRGREIDPEAVARAIELSQTKYCSASIMLKQAGMDLQTDFRIEADPD